MAPASAMAVRFACICSMRARKRKAIMLGSQEKMIRGLAFETGATRDQEQLWSTGSGGQLMGWLIDTETNRSQGRALEARVHWSSIRRRLRGGKNRGNCRT